MRAATDALNRPVAGVSVLKPAGGELFDVTDRERQEADLGTAPAGMLQRRAQVTTCGAARGPAQLVA
jgi:hypothetical protein